MKLTGPHAKLRRRQQCGKCFFCGNALNGKESPDHFIPKCRGGSSAWTNIVIAHPTCNTEKGSRMPTVEEFDRFLAVVGHQPVLAPGGFVPDNRGFRLERVDESDYLA